MRAQTLGSQSFNLKNILSKDYVIYAAVFLITLLRCLSNAARPCLEYFDCNAYIQMSHSIAYNPELLSHHAMRILPPLVVQGLQFLGLSTEGAFKLLSDSTYIVFGLLCFYVLRQYVKPITALAFTLLCLAGHSAMRIPLQNVYQSCDMLVYPLSLLIVFFSLRHQTKWVFVLALVGILVRQNMFVLGVLSLAFLYWQQRQKTQLAAIVVLITAYAGLQAYYEATGDIAKMALAPEGFFTVEHIFWVINDSRILEIILPMLPIIALYYKGAIPFMLKNWHIPLYMAVVVGQPFIAYHLTGNNFDRLALQGLWLVYLIAPIVNPEKFQSKYINILLLGYAILVYATWSYNSRIIYMSVFAVLVFGYTLLNSPLPRACKPRRGRID